jgi:hypothetical protein
VSPGLRCGSPRGVPPGSATWWTRMRFCCCMRLGVRVRESRLMSCNQLILSLFIVSSGRSRRFYVSSLKGRGRSSQVEPVVSVFRRFLGGFGRATPESVSRRSARSEARTNGLDAGEDGAMLGRPQGRQASSMLDCRVPSSCVPRISKAGPWGFGRRSSLRRAGGGHEAVRLRQGGVNQAGDHAGSWWGS